ncbi:unnamed protein product [Rotaria socialis]|uniref:Major facilitator superfamily (MFS) profile domain-containing protein n=1 Tax=Rotaria socialis TaxID=392032 RepID=A0A817WJE4_9BILA|nr:unnamed protein product [Rotaria socialis]CAF3356596.1 unnamed protein product [Rotaria socialis]CAF4293781.1 unnamed protein product [Rotaria socialis]CAF4528490.1 unnamed protein product [Rotaria socialis]
MDKQLKPSIELHESGNNDENLELVEFKSTEFQDESSKSVVNKILDDRTNDDPKDKKLLRKLDLHIIPAMTLLYLICFLDRVNIGQAKLNGLTKTLNLSSIQYNNCLSAFFVTYILFEIPSNLILKKLRPSRWIPLIMTAWGVATTFIGRVDSYAGLFICRIILGAAESGFFPGINFYLSSWYKRREISWRVSILFSAVSLAGTFGGILAYTINLMHGIWGQEGWRWIFYIEGSITVIVGALSFLFISDFPSDRPKFLTENECDRVIVRLRTDAGPGASEHFSWSQVGSAFLDWKLYVWSLCGLTITVPVLSLNFFSPTIIANLGFANYQAQLLTAPPYAFAFITTMTTAYFSDKYARRGIFIMFWSIISIISYIILLLTENFVLKYFAIFIAVGSLTPSTAICISFLSCNISPHIKRATALAFMLSMCNVGGVIGGQIYRYQDAPRFIMGHSVNLVCCVLSFATATILVAALYLENQRRDRLYGKVNNYTASNAEADTIDIFNLGSAEGRQRWGYENMSEKKIRNLGDKHAAWRYIL